MWFEKLAKLIFSVQYFERWINQTDYRISCFSQIKTIITFCVYKISECQPHFSSTLMVFLRFSIFVFAYKLRRNKRNHHSFWYSLSTNGIVLQIEEMKIFQSLQAFYAVLDIYPTQSEKRASFNFHNVFIPLNFLVLFIFQIGFFLFKAKDIVEHAETFYSSLSILGCNAIFVTKFWEMPYILELIGNFERFVEKSE